MFWREEYILNARIAKFPKPYVAFMDGIVMGGGVGLSAHASHRVVTERTKLAMPEVGLGFFPDVGGTWLLSHAPGEIGTYFGLTGQTMNGPDAIYAGFADAVVPSDKLAALRDAPRQGAPPERLRTRSKPLIAGFATGETAGPRCGDAGQDRSRWFAHDRMEDIVARSAARRIGTGAGDAEDPEREIAAQPDGDAEAVAAGAAVFLAGGMSRAGISRRAAKSSPATISARACAPR